MSLKTISASLVREWFKCGIGMDCHEMLALFIFGVSMSFFLCLGSSDPPPALRRARAPKCGRRMGRPFPGRDNRQLRPPAR